MLSYVRRPGSRAVAWSGIAGADRPARDQPGSRASSQLSAVQASAGIGLTKNPVGFQNFSPLYGGVFVNQISHHFRNHVISTAARVERFEP